MVEFPVVYFLLTLQPLKLTEIHPFKLDRLGKLVSKYEVSSVGKGAMQLFVQLSLFLRLEVVQ